MKYRYSIRRRAPPIPDDRQIEHAASILARHGMLAETEDREMGMFDKDKEYGLRLDQEFPLGEEFVVWSATLPGKSIQTKVGNAEVAEFEVSHLDEADTRYTVNTVASAIVDKVRDADPDDFPAVVKLMRVPSAFGNEALVLQYLRDYKE